jgi:hypothetical protein
MSNVASLSGVDCHSRTLNCVNASAQFHEIEGLQCWHEDCFVVVKRVFRRFPSGAIK